MWGRTRTPRDTGYGRGVLSVHPVWPERVSAPLPKLPAVVTQVVDPLEGSGKPDCGEKVLHRPVPLVQPKLPRRQAVKPTLRSLGKEGRPLERMKTPDVEASHLRLFFRHDRDGPRDSFSRVLCTEFVDDPGSSLRETGAPDTVDGPSASSDIYPARRVFVPRRKRTTRGGKFYGSSVVNPCPPSTL